MMRKTGSTYALRSETFSVQNVFAVLDQLPNGRNRVVTERRDAHESTSCGHPAARIVSIPIQNSRGQVLRYAEPEAIEANPGHYHLHYNRRGHLRRAVLRERQNGITSLSRDGTSFEQKLTVGNVWALRGVMGSK